MRCDLWYLSGCSTNLEIEVLLRGGVSDFDERRFYATSEYQHVRDLRHSIAEMQRAGDSIEAYQRNKPYKTQEECELRATQLIQDTMKLILRNAQAQSHEDWDESGKHRYHSFRRWWGF